MDRVLFGDNQFFGVNHMSEEKARAQAMRFQDTQAIIDVLDAAYVEGIRTFMLVGLPDAVGRPPIHRQVHRGVAADGDPPRQVGRAGNDSA